MKTFLTLSLHLLITSFLFAQAPQGIPYQAVMRNADGSLMASNAVELTFMIHDGSATGTVVYQESHDLTSNTQGLVSCVVGNGVVSQGNFANINWGSGSKFLHVMMGTTDLGTQQMLSVPYALHSKSADAISNGIMINSISNDGDTLYLSNGQTFVSSSGQGSGNSGSLVLPIITTNAVTGITSNSATFSGSISNANGYEIMERGVVYATSPHPTINANKIQIGSGIGAFDSISAFGYQYAHLLSPNTTYYVRAYAITENSISVYGNEVSFQTLPVGEIGPGGGWVFFNKGNMDGGWQYLEVAPMDQSTSSQWGCSGTSVPGTSLLVGSGESNTNLILQYCPYAIVVNTECEFLFQLTDSYADGWNGGLIEVRDEYNLVVATLGSSFTSGGAASLSVTLNPGQYTLFWSTAGLYPEEMGLSVLDPMGEIIFNMGNNSQSLVNNTIGNFSVTNCGQLNVSNAAGLSFNLNIGEQTDWFLPSRDELYLVYRNLHVNGIGNLTNGDYWTSSESNSSGAWELDFFHGISHDYDKGYLDYVRAVRAF